MDYVIAKSLNEAHEIIYKYGDYPTRTKGDRTVLVYGFTCVEYSPQEIKILPRHYTGQEFHMNHRTLPDNVSWTGLQGSKQYLTLYVDGVITNWLIPTNGLRLRRDGTAKGEDVAQYQVLNPIKDYELSIDRKKASDNRKKFDDAYAYVRDVWDMLQHPEEPFDANDQKFKLDVPESWYGYVIQQKFYECDRGGYYSRPYRSTGEVRQRDTVLSKLRADLNQQALAYHVKERQPTDSPHYNEHWGMIEQAREAGLLIPFEGVPKKTRKKRK